MKINKHKVIGDAAIIGLITFMGYLCSYLYEWAYLSYYHVSLEFISVDIAKICISIIGIIFFLLSSVYFLSFCRKIGIFKLDIEIGIHIIILLLMLIVLFCTFILFYESKAWVAFLIVFFWCFIKWFVKPIFSKNGKGYYQKVLFSIKEENNNSNIDKITGVVFEKIGKKATILFLLCMLFCYLSYAWGKMTAVFKSNYTVFTYKEGQYVLIRNYKDFLLVKKINENTIDNQTTLINLTDIHKEEIFLQEKKINKLKIL